MPAATPRHKALRQLAEDPRAQAAAQAQAGPVPDDVSAWLADLQALIGIPFVYLVPDARMLPAESIRFFVVDPNWTAAAADGALSLAARTAPGAAAIKALRPGALAASRQAGAGRRRAAATSAADTGTAAGTAPAYSGFLLRSATVSDWPGLSVSGYADPQAATPALPIVRLERLAPTVLLGLFPGLIESVVFTEPAQHLHFGIISAGEQTVSLRWIDPARAGTPLPGNPTATVSYRQDPNRKVLDVTATITAVTEALTPAYGSQPVPHLGSAGLGLQLIQGAASQTFATTAATPATAAADPGGTRPSEAGP
jgi:hypothetical protein